MPSGSTIISSVLKPLEDTLLALENLAFRTTPCIRHFLPRRPGRDPILGIALARIINIMAFKTDPPCILVVSWHYLLQLRFAVKTYQSDFSCGDMNTFLGANHFSDQKGAPAQKRPAGHTTGPHAGARGFFPQE